MPHAKLARATVITPTRYRVAVYVDGCAPPAVPVHLASDATKAEAEARATRTREYIQRQGWTHRVVVEEVPRAR